MPSPGCLWLMHNTGTGHTEQRLVKGTGVSSHPLPGFGSIPPELRAPQESSRVTHMVWFLSRVDSKVAFEGLQVPEARAADLAGVRLLPGVDEHVSTEVGHLRGVSPRSELPAAYFMYLFVYGFQQRARTTCFDFSNP